MSIVSIGARKAALFYGLKEKRHLRAFFEAVWHFESKERLVSPVYCITEYAFCSVISLVLHCGCCEFSHH
jgi:hypothetical protein